MPSSFHSTPAPTLSCAIAIPFSIRSGSDTTGFHQSATPASERPASGTKAAHLSRPKMVGDWHCVNLRQGCRAKPSGDAPYFHNIQHDVVRRVCVEGMPQVLRAPPVFTALDWSLHLTCNPRMPFIVVRQCRFLNPGQSQVIEPRRRSTASVGVRHWL